MRRSKLSAVGGRQKQLSRAPPNLSVLLLLVVRQVLISWPAARAANAAFACRAQDDSLASCQLSKIKACSQHMN